MMSDEPADGQDRRLTELLAPIGRMRFPPAATLVGRDYRPRRWIRVVSPMALVGVLVAAVAIVAVRPSGPPTTPTVPTTTAIGAVAAGGGSRRHLESARTRQGEGLDQLLAGRHLHRLRRLRPALRQWQVDASVLIVSPPSPPAGECPAKADLFLPGRSSPVAVRRGRLIVGSGADSAQLIPADTAATTARDGLRCRRQTGGFLATRRSRPTANYTILRSLSGSPPRWTRGSRSSMGAIATRETHCTSGRSSARSGRSHTYGLRPSSLHGSHRARVRRSGRDWMLRSRPASEPAEAICNRRMGVSPRHRAGGDVHRRGRGDPATAGAQQRGGPAHTTHASESSSRSASATAGQPRSPWVDESMHRWRGFSLNVCPPCSKQCPS